MKRLCIIPARAGSKRIPHKNIRKFCGKPMLAWSIELAKEANIFDKIMVSTDSETVADIARQYGAEIPFIRPESLANDHVGTTPVVAHALQWYQAQGITFDQICCLYATAPLLNPDCLKAGMNNLNKPDCLTSFAATTFPFPILRAIRRLPNSNGVEPMFSEHIGKRSQDLEEAYHDAGQFYWWTLTALEKNVDMFSSTSFPVILPRYLVQDIDTEEDWLFAEHMKQCQ